MFNFTKYTVDQYSSVDIWRALPENVKNIDRISFEGLQQINLKKPYFLRLHCSFVLSDGSVFKFIFPYKESFISQSHKLHNWRGGIRLLLNKKLIKLKKQHYIIAHNLYQGYYHWLIDYLPKLFCLREDFHDYTVLLPKHYHHQVFIDSLYLLGYNKIEYLDNNCIYKISTLVLPSMTAPMGNPNPQIMADMRNVILKKINSKPVRNKRRIYIRRKNITKRKVLNEIEIIDILKKYQFEIIHCEDLSFKEQVILFSSTKYLISIHGAGLSNMLFMPVGSHVLEMRLRDNNINYFYYSLASALGHYYYYQFCKSPNKNSTVQDADIQVDVEAFEKDIQMMLE